MANERSPLKMDSATSSDFEHAQSTEETTAAAAAALLSSPTAHQRAQPRWRQHLDASRQELSELASDSGCSGCSYLRHSAAVPLPLHEVLDRLHDAVKRAAARHHGRTDVAIEKWQLPVDTITYYGVTWNFAAVGVVAIFYQKGIPTYITQGYLVATSVIMAWQLSRFDEFTGWALLSSVALQCHTCTEMASERADTLWPPESTCKPYAAVAHQHAARKQSASAVSDLTVAAATARAVCHANLMLVAEFDTSCVLHTCTHIQLNDREYEQPMPGLLYEAELSGSSSSRHRADSADQQQQRRQIREQNSLSDHSSDVPIVDPEGPGVGLITASSVIVSGITVDSVTADSSSAGDAAAAAAAAAAHTEQGATLLDKSAHTAATTATADGA
eukprot:16614-Heterococcus_DN1.PRE.1